MVSHHHPAKFGDNMFLVVKGKIPYTLSSIRHHYYPKSAWYATFTLTRFQNVDTILCQCIQ